MDFIKIYFFQIFRDVFQGCFQEFLQGLLQEYFTQFILKAFKNIQNFFQTELLLFQRFLRKFQHGFLQIFILKNHQKSFTERTIPLEFLSGNSSNIFSNGFLGFDLRFDWNYFKKTFKNSFEYFSKDSSRITNAFLPRYI